jgi:hypothetical protein
LAPNVKGSKKWWTGQDSNLRRPDGRQIYSLLPLTTRAPVHKLQEKPSLFPLKSGLPPETGNEATPTFAEAMVGTFRLFVKFKAAKDGAGDRD